MSEQTFTVRVVGKHENLDPVAVARKLREKLRPAAGENIFFEIADPPPGPEYRAREEEGSPPDPATAPEPAPPPSPAPTE